MAPSGRDGYVIVAVLIVVVVLSLAAYTFTELMTTEHRAAVRAQEATQARMCAVSGIHYAAASLGDPATFYDQLGGNPTAAGAFHDAQGIEVFTNSNSPQASGRFSLIAVVPDGSGGYQRVTGAVVDEGGKLNINALIQLDPTGEVLYNALMKLPGMTEEAADAIVDWVDADDTARPNGAETSYYTGLGQGYACKNGPLNSLEELLLVKGVTPELLFGTDRNRNGIADDVEGQELNRGWSDYLTAYGRELNLDGSGVIRENLNDTEVENLPGLHQRLIAKIGQEPADFIMAYRLFQSTTMQTTTTTDVLNSSNGMAIQVTVRRTTQTTGQSNQQNTRAATADELSKAVQDALAADSIRMQGKRPKSILELMNVQITLPKPQDAPMNDPTPVYTSPFTDPSKLNAWLPALMDKSTTQADTAGVKVELIPRLNVNTAPREVLMGLPNLTETDVSNILSKREGLSGTDPATLTGAWLLTSGAIPVDKFQAIEKYVTGTSNVFRIQAIGYARPGGPVARVEAVIDTNRGAPRIVYFRDLTDLDNPRGFEPGSTQ